MTLETTVEQNIKNALKAGDSNKLSTLRLLKAAMINYKIEKKKESLQDSDFVEIIQRQVKQRKDSIESYEKAGRKDLANKESDELAVLLEYLPKQLSDDEIKDLALKAIKNLSVTQKSESGRVMKELMPQVRGKTDGKRVQEIVLNLLA